MEELINADQGDGPGDTDPDTGGPLDPYETAGLLLLDGDRVRPYEEVYPQTWSCDSISGFSDLGLVADW